MWCWMFLPCFHLTPGTASLLHTFLFTHTCLSCLKSFKTVTRICYLYFSPHCLLNASFWTMLGSITISKHFFSDISEAFSHTSNLKIYGLYVKMPLSNVSNTLLKQSSISIKKTFPILPFYQEGICLKKKKKAIKWFDFFFNKSGGKEMKK